MKSSITNEVLLEDNGQPVLHKSVMTPNDELYLKVNNDKLQFKHQMSDAFVDLSTTLDLPEIVQVTGTFTDKVMSQNAVTNALNTKANADSVVNKTDIVQSTGSSETKAMSQKAVTNMLAQKANVSDVINKTDIVHQPGTANDKVMSQNTTTYNLNLKVDKTAIVQATGNATDKIMSQDAVTKALAAVGADIQVVQTTGSSQTSVMSQKAVTDQVNLKLDKTALATSTGNGTDVTMTQKAITEFVDNSFTSLGTILTRFERDIADNTANIANHSTFIDQLIASNSTLVDDVTALKTNKADKTSVLLKADIAQGTGNSTTKVMSQDAVTNALNEKQPKGDYALKTEIPSIKVNNIAQTTLSFTTDPQAQIDKLSNNLNAVSMAPSDNFIDNIIEKPTNTGINYNYTAVANGYIQINIVPTSATETIHHSLVINKLATASSNYGYSGSYYMTLPIRKGQTANFVIYNNIDKIKTFSARFIYAEVV